MKNSGRFKFVNIIFALLAGVAYADEICPIEVGSGGVKARVVDLTYDSQCNLMAKTRLSLDENTNIVQSMQEGKFSQDAIKATADAVAKLGSKMKEQYPSCVVFAVGSSGVAVGKNTDELRQAVAAVGLKDMSFITPAQEAEYGFKSSIPTAKRLQALLIDIGSGNTKIGYLDPAKAFHAMDVPFGSTSLAKKAESTGLPTRFGVAKSVMSDVLPQFREGTAKHPEVLKRNNVYWIGGAAWATATYARPDQADKAIVKITRTDLEDFLIALEKDTWKNREAPAGMSESAKLAWEKDWGNVKKIFSRERLIAGVTLMKVMLSDGIYREDVTFPRYGQWLFGYSVEFYKIASPGCSH